MSYPLFALIFLGGFVLTLILVALRLAGVCLPWLAILAPLGLGWAAVSCDYIRSVFLWHYHPPFPWEQIGLCLFVYVLICVILRGWRSSRVS